MTRQSHADDGRDVATADVVGHHIRESRKDTPSGASDAQGRAVDRDPLLTRQPLVDLTGTLPARMRMRIDLARLESAFPAFSFAISSGWHGLRIEAWRDTTLSGLYAIITDDPDELWRELDMALR